VTAYVRHVWGKAASLQRLESIGVLGPGLPCLDAPTREFHKTGSSGQLGTRPSGWRNSLHASTLAGFEYEKDNRINILKHTFWFGGDLERRDNGVQADGSQWPGHLAIMLLTWLAAVAIRQ
jgi:hypothetical protein